MVYRYPGSQKDEPVIEGRYELGQRVLIIDDIISTGGSILETAEALREAGLLVTDAVVLVDRQLGAVERLKPHGINLISILGVEQLLNYLVSVGKINTDSHRRSMELSPEPRPRRPWRLVRRWTIALALALAAPLSCGDDDDDEDAVEVSSPLPGIGSGCG